MGEWGYSYTHASEQSASHLSLFAYRERKPSIHSLEGWVDSTASLDTAIKTKILLFPGIKPPVIQP
jgi:hypothetical protein